MDFNLLISSIKGQSMRNCKSYVVSASAINYLNMVKDYCNCGKTRTLCECYEDMAPHCGYCLKFQVPCVECYKK